MMFDPTTAVIRFGMGLSPAQPLPTDIDALLAETQGPSAAETRFPIPPFASATPTLQAQALLNRARFDARDTPQEADAEKAVTDQRKQMQRISVGFLRATFARSVDAPIGFRERLVSFWADHFTVKARGGNTRHLISPYIEEAIRPHITGRFIDLLRAADTHPMMLIYLQQAASVGPNSVLGLRRGRGLNENLAREMIELHTLGVGSNYSQSDVQEMAALLSGLTFDRTKGMHYDPRRAEPGAETVLGTAYGAEADPRVIENALEDLAVHPATAQHIAHKLATHFVADVPDPALVTAIADTFLTSDGDLAACYRTLLTHPTAWAPETRKVRTPNDFLIGALRTLDVSGADIMAFDGKATRQIFINPLRVMGQPWHNPTGPDGWPDRAEDWIIPQAMAARISWAMRAPARLRDPLPDPRALVATALGPNPDPAVVFAAGAAETRSDGIGVILASAAFNRR